MARAFNGTSQYLSRASAVVSSYPFTLACWIRPTNDTDRQAVLSLADNTVDTRHALLDILGNVTGDLVRGQIQSGGSFAAVTSTAGYTVNTWYHVCIVFESSTNRHVYINGANKQSNTTSLAIPTLNTTSIGRSGKSATNLYYAGRVAEAGFWSTNLNDSQVALLASGYAPSLVAAASLAAYYPLSSDDNDASGNGNHLTASGSPTFEDHPPGIVYELASWWAWNQFGRVNDV